MVAGETAVDGGVVNDVDEMSKRMMLILAIDSRGFIAWLQVQSWKMDRKTGPWGLVGSSDDIDNMTGRQVLSTMVRVLGVV